MSARVPDLQQSVVVDFPRGRIESRAQETERLVALPAAWFARVFELPGPFDDLADALAEALAKDALVHLDGENDPTPEDVATAISVATAARGLGLVSFERWGDLLCVLWRDPPVASKGVEGFAERVFARVVGDVIGLDVSGVVIDRDAARLTVLLAREETSAHVRALVAQGVTLPRLADHLTAGDEA